MGDTKTIDHDNDMCLASPTCPTCELSLAEHIIHHYRETLKNLWAMKGKHVFDHESAYLKSELDKYDIEVEVINTSYNDKDEFERAKKAYGQS
jgi:hypothetical protein